MPDPVPQNHPLPPRDPASDAQPPAPFPASAWEALLADHQKRTGEPLVPRMQAVLEALRDDLPFLGNSRKESLSRVSDILWQALQNVISSSTWTIDLNHQNSLPLNVGSAAANSEASFSDLLICGVDFKATDRGAKLLLHMLHENLSQLCAVGYKSSAGKHILTQFLFLAANGGFPLECESILTSFYMTSIERSRISTYLNESPKEAGVNKAYAKLCEILADRV
jgi:hypothetical protein